MIGTTFGLLTVLRKLPPKKGSRDARYQCACACVSWKRVVRTGAQLRNGSAKHCGCVRRKVNDFDRIRMRALHTTGLITASELARAFMIDPSSADYILAGDTKKGRAA